MRSALLTAVGVPVIEPLDGSKLKPSGSVPDSKDQLYGACPPLAVRRALYVLLTRAVLRDFVKIPTALTTFICNFSETDPL